MAVIKCTFCGIEQEDYKGTYYFRNDGTILYFSSSKCLKNHLKLKAEELSEDIDAANSSLYGKSWKAERNAVGILIFALTKPSDLVQNKALTELKKLTGQDFGTDFEKWSDWWKENRASFRRPRNQES